MGFHHRISFLLLLALTHACTSTAQRRTNAGPSTMIVGTVYCDTCFHQKFSRISHLISGASVLVDCTNQATDTGFRKAVETDKDGVFRVHLPPEIGKHIKRIKACSVKLISSNEPFCAVAASATSSSFHLKSARNKAHVFSSGFFTFRPMNQPELCYQRPSVERSPKFAAAKDITIGLPLPSLDIPPIHLLPPWPPLESFPPSTNLPQFPPSATPANPSFPAPPPLLPSKKADP